MTMAAASRRGTPRSLDATGIRLRSSHHDPPSVTSVTPSFYTRRTKTGSLLMTTSAAPATTHPLAQLSADEVTAAREVLVHAGLVVESSRFVYVGLEEPGKADLYGGDVTPD